MPARLACLVCALALVALWSAPASAAPLVPHHRATGDYFGFAASGYPDYRRDRLGLPLVPYDGVLHYNPTTIGQYGLWRFSKWRRTRSGRHLRQARRAADWLVRSQQPSGVWLYSFRFGISGIFIEPPWMSGLAQGTGISLLARMFHVTGKRVYLRTARKALEVLRVPLGAGGLRAEFQGNRWYAEYPIGKGTLELTGMLLTLLGLHDLRPVSPLAGRLYKKGRRSLSRMLPLYDAGGGLSYYNLGHLTLGVAPQYEPSAYGSAHVRLLRLLDSFEPERLLLRYARRWARSPQVTLRSQSSAFSARQMAPGSRHAPAPRSTSIDRSL